MKTLLSPTPSPNKKGVTPDIRSGNRIYLDARTNEANSFKNLSPGFNQKPNEHKTK